MSGAKPISSTKAKSLIEQTTESTRVLTWLMGMRNSYAVIDRYCVLLIQDMHLQTKWDAQAETLILAMQELSEAKIEILDNAIQVQREKHDRLMVELDNETD